MALWIGRPVARAGGILVGMSAADIETLRAEYEAISRRDWDAVFVRSTRTSS
jgi:hypothetical protein